MKTVVPLCAHHADRAPWKVRELAEDLERLGVVWCMADDTTPCILCIAVARMYDLDLSAFKPTVITTVVKRRRRKARG